MARLKLSDGGYLAYEDKGAGQPIVLLHGWGMRGKYFQPQIEALSSRYRTIVPDLRGHGESSRLEEGQDLETLVGDVAALLGALDLSQTLLVGWSMGAMVSWGLMRRAEAGRVSSLVSIDMVPKLLNNNGWKFGLRDGQDASVFADVADRMLADWPAFTRVFVPRIFAPNDARGAEKLADKMIGETEKNDPASMAQLWLSMADLDFREQLSEIKVPTLVTYGALSQLYSEAASEWVINRMPNARGVRFAHSGHAPHLEEPNLFNTEIETFVEQTKDLVAGSRMT